MECFHGSSLVKDSGRPYGREAKTAVSPYRYGFNGKGNDNEIKGEGNQQDYRMRIYDPRLGRFLSVTPRRNSILGIHLTSLRVIVQLAVLTWDGLEYLNFNEAFESKVTSQQAANHVRKGFEKGVVTVDFNTAKHFAKGGLCGRDC